MVKVLWHFQICHQMLIWLQEGKFLSPFNYWDFCFSYARNDICIFMIYSTVEYTTVYIPVLSFKDDCCHGDHPTPSAGMALLKRPFDLRSSHHYI